MAQLVGSTVAESAFSEGSYDLVTYQEGEGLFESVGHSHDGSRVAVLPICDTEPEYADGGRYAGLARLSSMAPVEELCGAFRLDVISSRPAWQSEYERFWTEVQVPGETRSSSRLLLLHGNVVAGRLVLEAPEQRRSIVSISPGDYSLMLDTGRLIWEGSLTNRDLIWSEAFPGKPLDLAADTGATQLQPTRQESLLGGELILRVFPGLESGRLEIEAR